MNLDQEGDYPHRPGAPEIEALALLGTEAEMVDALRDIAGGYGNITAVSPIATVSRGEAETRLFSVSFERTVDAMAASRGLQCYLFGFSTLIVPVPRNDHGG